MLGDGSATRRGVWISLLLSMVLAGPGRTAAEEGASPWGYDCAEGAPFVWGRLAPAYAVCGDGKTQSPIDVSTTGAVRKPLPPLAPVYGPSDLEVVNDGHTVKAQVPVDAARLRVGERTYRLVQFHWHTPSEHWVDGERYPMELHLVHADENGRLVLGALVKEGRANRELEKIWAVLPREPGDHAEVHGFDLSALLPASLRSYRYPGSLTTPPCDQGIQWVLLAEPVEMSAGQIETFRKIFFGTDRFPVGNARPVQPSHGREVATDSGGE
jgi:carbonic anhydrase